MGSFRSARGTAPPMLHFLSINDNHIITNRLMTSSNGAIAQPGAMADGDISREVMDEEWNAPGARIGIS